MTDLDMQQRLAYLADPVLQALAGNVAEKPITLLTLQVKFAEDGQRCLDELDKLENSGVK